jgi:hypothetical protein
MQSHPFIDSALARSRQLDNRLPLIAAERDFLARRVTERDFKGNIIRQHEEIIFADKLRSDAWYLSFAPLDKPVLAMAVLVEGPGPGVSFYGGTNAAPIAAQVILKAKALGYFGGTGVSPPPPRQLQQTIRPAARRPAGTR